MHTFSQEPETMPQTTSAKPTAAGRAHSGQSRGLHLQRAIGNRAVQRLLHHNTQDREAGSGGAALPSRGQDFSRAHVRPPTEEAGQTNLAINPPGDEREQEADHIAEQVMRTPESGAPRVRAGRGEEGRTAATTVRRAYAPASSPGSTLKQGDAAHASPDAPGIVGGVVSESGRPLDPLVRAFMEPRFGQEFSDVRIHTGSRAAESARAVAATAYTVGRHVVFGEGAYRPETDAGRRLIAHELTHVVQQAAAGPSVQRKGEGDAQKLKPPVPCNEIIPYKVGTTLLVTHLLDKAIAPDRIGNLKSLATSLLPSAGGQQQQGAGQSPDLMSLILAHPAAAIDLLTSADVPKSATATITKSDPELVEATVGVPALPAKDDLPASQAFDGTLTLSFNTVTGLYDVKFTRETAGKQTSVFSASDLQFSKTGEGIQIGTGNEDNFKIKLVPGGDGGMQLQAFDITPLARMIGIGGQLTLVNVAPTSGQPAEVKQTEEKVRSEHKAPPKLTSPQIYGGIGFQYAERSEALFSLGWRFTFSPDLGRGIVQVPLAFQFDYAPRADFLGGVYTGGKVSLPTKVPLTLSAIIGARGGSIMTQGSEGHPGSRVGVGGPAGGLDLGVQITPRVDLQIDTSLMWNALRLKTDQGPTWIPTVGLSAAVKL